MFHTTLPRTIIQSQFLVLNDKKCQGTEILRVEVHLKDCVIFSLDLRFSFLSMS